IGISTERGNCFMIKHVFFFSSWTAPAMPVDYCQFLLNLALVVHTKIRQCRNISVENETILKQVDGTKNEVKSGNRGGGVDLGCGWFLSWSKLWIVSWTTLFTRLADSWTKGTGWTSRSYWCCWNNGNGRCHRANGASWANRSSRCNRPHWPGRSSRRS